MFINRKDTRLLTVGIFIALIGVVAFLVLWAATAPASESRDYLPDLAIIMAFVMMMFAFAILFLSLKKYEEAFAQMETWEDGQRSEQTNLGQERQILVWVFDKIARGILEWPATIYYLTQVAQQPFERKNLTNVGYMIVLLAVCLKALNILGASPDRLKEISSLLDSKLDEAGMKAGKKLTAWNGVRLRINQFLGYLPATKETQPLEWLILTNRLGLTEFF